MMKMMKMVSSIAATKNVVFFFNVVSKVNVSVCLLQKNLIGVTITLMKRNGVVNHLLNIYLILMKKIIAIPRTGDIVLVSSSVCNGLWITS